MSKTKRFPTSPSNPVTRYFSWKGAEKDGHFAWWDKQSEQEVAVDFPFVFLPLKQLSCVTGYNSQQEESIYSNEVERIGKDVLNVRVGKNTIEQGLYSNIKDTIKAKGGKYTSSVYIAFKDESGELKIGNIKFSGSSLGPWIDLQNSPADLSSHAVVVKGNELDDSGGIHFKYPVLSTKEVSSETNQKADELYEELVEYIDWKLENNETIEQEETDQAENVYSEPDDQLDSSTNLDDEKEVMDDLPF